MNLYAIKHPSENSWACTPVGRVWPKGTTENNADLKEIPLFYRWNLDIHANEVTKFSSSEEARAALANMWQLHETSEIQKRTGYNILVDFKRSSILNNQWKAWGLETMTACVEEVPKVELPFFDFGGQIVAMDISRGTFYNGHGMGTQSEGVFCAPTVRAVKENLSTLGQVLWQHARTHIGDLVFLETHKGLPAKPVSNNFSIKEKCYLVEEYARLERSWYDQKEAKLRDTADPPTKTNKPKI